MKVIVEARDLSHTDIAWRGRQAALAARLGLNVNIQGELFMARSDKAGLSSMAPPHVQTCPQCGGEMRVKRREPAPGNPNMERLFLECAKCGNTAGKMQAKAKA